MEIILIRHGKTDANERRLYCGSTDLPLSENGVVGLRQLLDSHTYPDVAGMRVCTSGMLRADQTLSAIYGPAIHDTIPGLRELDFGKFEMHSYDELKEDPDYLAWITDDSGETRCPGGESSAIFKKRVFEAFDELVNNEDSAVVVCHGGVIAEIMARLFPDSGKNFYEWQPSAGCGYAISFSGTIPKSFTQIPL